MNDRAGIEAFQLAVELLVPGRDQRGRERLVERVVPEDPGIAPEVGRHGGPHPVVLALEVADDVVGPEVAVGRSRRGGPVVLGPPAGWLGVRRSAGAHRPVRRPLSVEQLVVDVLVHVEQRVDVETTEQVDGLFHLAEVCVENRLAELARIMGRAGRADGGVVRRSGPGLKALPGHAKPNDVEPEPRHQRRVGGAEVPRLAGGRVELVGRVLVDRVHPMEEDDSTLLVVEERTTRRVDLALDDGARRAVDRRSQARKRHGLAPRAVGQQHHRHH